MTEHRFTALYRFDKDSLHNLYFFDRENPAQTSTPDIPVMASYCVFVRNSGHVFSTPDALQDERVRGHPKRHEVQSYVGVPLLDQDGKMFGSVCHFDIRPVAISDESVHLLEEIGPWMKKLEAAREAV